MKPDVHEALDPLETAWFDAPRRSSRPPKASSPFSTPPPPPSAPPPPPIDDAIADHWFR